METMIAPCGMNCALCLAYQRDKLSCMGCNSESAQKPKHCLSCSIKYCPSLLERNADYCFECAKFPCRRLKQLDARYQKNYHMSMLENLAYVREKGIESFVRNEHSRWDCPDCGGLICVHRGYCLTCNPKK